jgi:hypothetical protein
VNALTVAIHRTADAYDHPGSYAHSDDRGEAMTQDPTPPARVVNPEAIGNPDITPIVECSPALVAYLAPCQEPITSRDGDPCGGVNRFHHIDCPKATDPDRTFT